MVGGAIAFAAVQAPSGTSDSVESATTGDAGDGSLVELPEAGSSSGSGGEYLPYTDTAIADATGSTVLLFFHASWCPSCRAVESTIAENGVPEGVTVIKVDYDSHQDLRQKYDVTQQTTFVKVDAGGEKIDSFPPSTDLTIDAVVEELA